jgi:hypothetical protein
LMNGWRVEADLLRTSLVVALCRDQLQANFDKTKPILICLG